jgi:hypothetical protein
METPAETASRGIWIHGAQNSIALLQSADILALFGALDLLAYVLFECASTLQEHSFRLWLNPSQAMDWAPGWDTLSLATTLGLDVHHRPDDLTREVLLCMLMGPVAFEFPSVRELVSAVRIRCNVVRAARKTSLAFHTSQAERPEDCWVYNDDYGFTIKPEASLIDALIKATQPEVSGAQYAFSCYRASEYVLLLGIAQELQVCNLPLYQALQELWAHQPIKSGKFHDVFLREQGSMDAPLPPYYFVPGDRTWFRNPDATSADASGFEGSWVIYLGGGQFCNFWKHEKPYTLLDKCLEIYHWRNGLYFDAEGEQRIDEAKVAVLVEASRKDPMETAHILAIMKRYREPRGVYTDVGGCLDTTREFARWVCPGTADLVLPALSS